MISVAVTAAKRSKVITITHFMHYIIHSEDTHNDYVCVIIEVKFHIHCFCISCKICSLLVLVLMTTLYNKVDNSYDWATRKILMI